MSSFDRAPRLLVLAASLGLFSSGCSYALVHGPPSPLERGEPAPPAQVPPGASCTSSNAAPVLDTIGAVGFLGLGALGVAALIDSESCPSGHFCLKGPGTYAAVAVGGFALASLFIASAATGYGRTADCRRWEARPATSASHERYLLDVREIALARSAEEVESAGDPTAGPRIRR